MKQYNNLGFRPSEKLIAYASLGAYDSFFWLIVKVSFEATLLHLSYV